MHQAVCAFPRPGRLRPRARVHATRKPYLRHQLQLRSPLSRRRRRRRRLVRSATTMIAHPDPPAPVRRPSCQQIGTVVRGKGRSHHTIPFPFDYPQLLNCKRILHAAFSIGHTFSDDGDRERQNGREGGREGEREGGGYDSLISRRRRNPGPTPIVDFEALDAHFVAKTGVRCGGGAAWLTIAEC